MVFSLLTLYLMKKVINELLLITQVLFIYRPWAEREDLFMKKKTLISVLVGLASLLFVYVLVSFVLGLMPVAVVAEGETASFWIKSHEFFVDQYNFMIDHLAFLIVLLVFFVGLIAISIKYLVPKKIGSKKDTRYGVKYNKTTRRK